MDQPESQFVPPDVTNLISAYLSLVGEGTEVDALRVYVGGDEAGTAALLEPLQEELATIPSLSQALARPREFLKDFDQIVEKTPLSIASKTFTELVRKSKRLGSTLIGNYFMAFLERGMGWTNEQLRWMVERGHLDEAQMQEVFERSDLKDIAEFLHHEAIVHGNAETPEYLMVLTHTYVGGGEPPGFSDRIKALYQLLVDLSQGGDYVYADLAQALSEMGHEYLE